MFDKSVSVIGTGDFGRALGKRLINSNYTVVFGSRRPNNKNLSKIDKDFAQATVVSIEEAIRASNVIFMAVPVEVYPSLEKYRSLLEEKIVVDVSNARKKSKSESNAERLAATLPTSRVVKAFNTVSAFSMLTDAAGERRLVYYCGEDSDSRDVVRQVCRDMGFVPMDCGGLIYARKLEAIPLKMMSGWGTPGVVVLLTSIWWFFYGCLRYFYLKEDPYTKERFPLNVTNKAFGCISLTLLCFAFIPGCLAGFAQMINGTKHKRFPAWLDCWMKMRKHLGYFALLSGGIHTIMSVCILNPAYYSAWFQFKEQTIVLEGAETATLAVASRMTWVGETVGLLGVLGIAGMTVMGVTSLPSVASQLNWSEWRFFQSYVGWFTVLVAAGHVSVLGLGGGWLDESFYLFGQKMSFLSCLIPWLTIFLKVLVSLPGVTCYLTKIRNGYERGQSDKIPVEYVTYSNGRTAAGDKPEVTINGGQVTADSGKQAATMGQDNRAFVELP